MSRLAILNMFIGFVAVSFATAGGFFVALEAEQLFKTKEFAINNWHLTLMKSAHGHLNLYGYLHILFGVTLPYSRCPNKIKLVQTLGLAMGTLTMGLLVSLRAFQEVPKNQNLMGFLIGCLLFTSLISISVHCVGLGMKLMRV